MSHLHTLNNPALLSLCLKSCEPGDRLLLLEDGVYCAVRKELVERLNGLAVSALVDDLEARGLLNRLDPSVETATSVDFVNLCCDASHIINWF